MEGKEAPHYNEEKLIMEVEAQAQREAEQRMDEGPLTLETLNRTEEGGEAFLDLLKELLADGGGGAVAAAAAAGTGAIDGEEDDDDQRPPSPWLGWVAEWLVFMRLGSTD